MQRRYSRLLMIVGILLAAIVVGLVSNATYLNRTRSFFTQDQVRGVEWFSPTVEMQPSATPVALLSESTADAIAANEFSQTLDVAKSSNTSALLVWHRGRLALEYYAQGFNARSPVQTNSVHKSALALLVGIAIDEGAIDSVDDPVQDYLGDWVQQGAGTIRIKHLLGMSSGLAAPPSRFKLFDHSLRLMHGADIAAVARQSQQANAPGQQFDYRNTNAQLLVEVLEAATGESYERYFSRKLWSKFAEHPGALWMDREGGTPHGFCCLISSPRDLLRLGLIVLNDGRIGGQQIVPSDWIQAMQQPSEVNPNYGYLLWRGTPFNKTRTYAADSDFGALHSAAYPVDDLVFFDGFGGQRVYIIPSLQLVIVRVGESRFDFDDALLPNQVIAAIKPSQAHSTALHNSAEPDRKVGISDTRIEAPHTTTLDVRVGYPMDERAQFPLIVFSHGNGLSNAAYDALIEGWVRAGFVVAAPGHLDVGDRAQIDALTQTVGSDWIAASRVLDMRAVIDRIDTILADQPGYQGTVEPTRVIAAGHSFGAYSAQLLGGAHYQRKGDSTRPIPAELKDARVVAVVGLSSPGVLPGVLSRAAWDAFDTPQLVVTGTNDTFEFLWTNHEDHFVAYEAARPGHNSLLVVQDMDHYMGNLIGRLQADVPPQHAALATVVSASAHFMQAYLTKGSTQAARDSFTSASPALRQSNVARFEQR